MGDIADEKLSKFIEFETKKFRNIIDSELAKYPGFQKLFKNEIKCFIEIMKQMLAAHVFQRISDIKLKLMMEEIKLHYLFLQFIDIEALDLITSLVIESKNKMNNLIEPNKIYKRNSV